MSNIDTNRDDSNNKNKIEDNVVEVKLCQHCGKEISNEDPRHKSRKFCSIKCNRRFFSLQRYHKIKDTKEYKDYRKEYFKTWLDKNRDKFNASMRKASLKYQKKKKEELNLNKKKDQESKVNEVKEINKVNEVAKVMEVKDGIM